MAKVISLSGVVVCLLASVPALAQCPAAPQAELTVRGTGTVGQKPDLAALTISVLTRGPTLDTATNAHEGRVAQAKTVLDHLRTEGVSVDQGSFSLSEEHSPVAPGVRPGSEPPTYRAETRYGLTIKALDKLDGIAAEIVSAGLFEIGSARFTVERKSDAYDQARRAAMADARHQAEVYADAAGLQIDGVERITDGAAAGADGAFDLPVRLARSASVGITPPKTLEFQGSVTVTWRIVPR